jgi:hypothetical protein
MYREYRLYFDFSGEIMVLNARNCLAKGPRTLLRKIHHLKMIRGVTRFAVSSFYHRRKIVAGTKYEKPIYWSGGSTIETRLKESRYSNDGTGFDVMVHAKRRGLPGMFQIW